MILWCAYCQKFQGEIPPFEDFALSHGLCKSCAARGLDLSDEEFDQVLELKAIQASLLQAGIKKDAIAADEAIATAIKAGVRPVDVLMGLLAPILWQIGERWATGEITVADEHQFTTFYSATIARLEARSGPMLDPDANSEVDILLLNASGNVHFLGVRLLNLWLQSEGVRTMVLSGRPSVDSILSYIEKLAPKFLGISVALSEHFPAALRLADELSARTSSRRPQILIGGSAVKAGLIPSADGVTLIVDPHSVLDLIRTKV